jgi:hypothetical protein
MGFRPNINRYGTDWYEEVKNHQLSSYGEWHVRKVQQNNIQHAWVVGITSKQNWKAYIGPMIHSYNCTRHESRGQTPYLLPKHVEYCSVEPFAHAIPHRMITGGF